MSHGSSTRRRSPSGPVGPRPHTIGIEELMRDLAEPGRRPSQVCMLGGGAPARIPQVEAVWRRRMREILDDADTFERVVACYEPPQGPVAFLDAVAACVRQRFGWPVQREHVVVTNGSQSAWFLMVQLLRESVGAKRTPHILLPRVPEYIGYADLAGSPTPFVGALAEPVPTGARRFRHQLAWDRLRAIETFDAIAVSGPSNPTGGILEAEELSRLTQWATERKVPLILDHAYGPPFPDIMFRTAPPIPWSPYTILCLSLSKLGLPGLRTGIVVTTPERAERLARWNAIAALAPGGLGPAIVTPLLRSGELERLCHEVLRPWYRERRDRALAFLEEYLPADAEWYVHEPDGAFFLWLWFPTLTVSSYELYRRLKAKGVVIVSGHYFFYGRGIPRAARDRFIRLSYAQPDEVLRRGLQILGHELHSLLRKAPRFRSKPHVADSTKSQTHRGR